MTSKEALEILSTNYIYDGGTHQEVIEEINKIEQDLEILEILKPMLEIKKGSSWEYLDTKHCFFDTQEQIEIIKEWLNNDSN